jgi:U32 family peptidase
MLKRRKISPELLAPAGNMEKMKTALAFGADAVYAGVPAFSLRTRINDFDISKINEAVKYCHERGKRIYATINIVAHNRHLKDLPGHIRDLKKSGVDALIIADPGIMEVVKEEWPEAEIHLSTQANCVNWRSADFWHKQGIKRIILGRETTLVEIKEIHKKVSEVELEYFVHGAMCMAYSGRCFLSKFYLDRSGNLGDCVQPCRWGFTSGDFRIPDAKKTDIKAIGHDECLELTEDEHGSYIFNSKDLCLIKHLRELAEAGVSSFKIEGRAKSVYYQAVIAGIYSRAIRGLEKITKEELDFLYSELNDKLIHRGYTEGFLFGGRADQNTANSHEGCAWEFCGQVMHNANQQINANAANNILVKVHNSIKAGDEIEIIRPGYGIIKMKVDRLFDAETGEEITEAHGGQGREVLLECGEGVEEFSVIRRRVV